MNLQCHQITDEERYVKNINGDGYRIVEEDKGDGRGFVKVFQERI